MLALQDLLKPVYGLPTWNVRGGYGSFLSFEMGKPSLEIREPIKLKSKPTPATAALARRGVTVVGQWHLWVYCCAWRVRDRRKFVGNGGSRRSIEKAARFLNGQALTRIQPLKRAGSCRFEFDFGGILETEPYDRESEQWLLYFPNDAVLAMRWDGLFSYEKRPRSPETAVWQRVRRGA